MTNFGERPRVLLAASPDIHELARDLFLREPLDSWIVQEADGFSRARFVQQHSPCDLLLVHDELFEREGGQGMSWLAWQREMPVVYLAGASPERMARAFRFGAGQCVSWEASLCHPPLLAAAMDRALHAADVFARLGREQIRLQESQNHIDRLVNLIWRMSPRPVENHWFSQRYMLERLQEELARAERHSLPLSLAIGELQPNDAGEKVLLPDWVVESIVRGKRRCDVAGQYGINGFMLLMVHTPVEGGVTCCQRLQKIIEHDIETRQDPHDTFRSFFGLAGVTPERNTSLTLLRAAEESLEAARARKEELVLA